MRVQNRRMIGLMATGIFMLVYIFLAASIGNVLANKSQLVQIIFFIIAGFLWVIPLRPIYMWMATKPEEIIQKEKPPRVSIGKKRR